MVSMIKMLSVLGAISIISCQEIPLYTYSDLAISLAVKPVIRTLDKLVKPKTSEEYDVFETT